MVPSGGRDLAGQRGLPRLSGRYQERTPVSEPPPHLWALSPGCPGWGGLTEASDPRRQSPTDRAHHEVLTDHPMQGPSAVLPRLIEVELAGLDTAPVAPQTRTWRGAQVATFGPGAGSKQLKVRWRREARVDRAESPTQRRRTGLACLFREGPPSAGSRHTAAPPRIC